MTNIELFYKFKKNQTLMNLQELKNNDIKLLKLTNLSNNQQDWLELHEYKLPFNNIIPLYKKENNHFIFYGIGIY